MSADVDGETNDRVDGDDNDDCAEKARPRRRRRIADRATAFIVEIVFRRGELQIFL